VDPLLSPRSLIAEPVIAATSVAAPTFKSIRRIPQPPSRPTRTTRAVQRFRALVLAFLPPSLLRVTAEEGISSSNSSPDMYRGPCERPDPGADATRTWTPASGTATSTGALGNTEPTSWQRHRVVLGGSRWTRLRAILVPLAVSVVCPPLRPPVFPRTNAAPNTPSALRIRRRPLPGSIPMRRAAARRLPVRSTSFKRRTNRSSEYRTSRGFETEENLPLLERGEPIDHRCSEPLITLAAGCQPCHRLHKAARDSGRVVMTTRMRWMTIAIGAAIVASTFALWFLWLAPQPRVLIVGSTTTTQDTGLLDVLQAEYNRQT